MNKREDGTFTALMLALALEDYASKCTEPYFTLNTYVDSKYTTEEPSGSIPSLPEFPEKTDWRSIGVDQASQVLGFRVKVDTAHSYLRDTWTFEGKVSTWGNASTCGIELGSEALRVARALRAEFKLPPMVKDDRFDPEAFFAEQERVLAERRAAFKVKAAETSAATSASA